VRTAPNTDGKKLGVAHEGDKLLYQGETREAGGRPWYLVEWQNANGWISSKYSELTQ